MNENSRKKLTFSKCSEVGSGFNLTKFKHFEDIVHRNRFSFNLQKKPKWN